MVFSLVKRKLQVCQKNTFHHYESFCIQHCPSAQVSFGELLRLVRGGDVPLQIEMPTPLLSSSAYTNTHHTFSTWPENQRLPRDSHDPFETAVTAVEPATSFFPQERRAGDEKKRRHTKWGIPKSHQGPNISLSLPKIHRKGYIIQRISGSSQFSSSIVMVHCMLKYDVIARAACSPLQLYQGELQMSAGATNVHRSYKCPQERPNCCNHCNQVWTITAQWSRAIISYCTPE